MLKERHANLVVAKVAEKIEEIRVKTNAEKLRKAKADPRLKQLKKLQSIVKEAEAKRDAVYDRIVKGINGLAYLNNNGTISPRHQSNYPSKSELSNIKMDVIHAILRGKVDDVDTLIKTIVANRTK